jgi:ParB family chromosome partitioning protein
MTQEQVADRVGLRRPTVANLVRLLELPEQVQALVSSDQISMGHARAILGAKEPQLQIELAKETVVQHWTVREIEARVRGLNRSPAVVVPSTSVLEKEAASPPWVAGLEGRLTASLGTKVAIRARSRERGTITIEFYGRNDLDRLLSILAPSEAL